MMEVIDLPTLVAVIVVLAGLFALVPLVFFWAVETLFEHHIDWKLSTVIAFWVIWAIIWLLTG